MPYGNLNVDVVQSSTANTPVQFNDGNGTQVGTLARAWVNFNGVSGSVAIRASFNVSSITRNGTGDYTISFTNAMPDANYSWFGSGAPNYGAGWGAIMGINHAGASSESAPTTSSARICIVTIGGVAYDCKYVNIGFFR